MGRSAASNLYDTSLGGKSIRLRGLSITDDGSLYDGAVVRWDNTIESWVPAIATQVDVAEA